LCDHRFQQEHPDATDAALRHGLTEKFDALAGHTMKDLYPGAKEAERSSLTLLSKTVSVWGWLVLCLLALGSNRCLGAKPYQPVFGDPMLETWRWRTFPELSGLDALCMAEGTDGTMWFGTANGLWSGDGIEWGVIQPTGLWVTL
jgi:hypothetical protein